MQGNDSEISSEKLIAFITEKLSTLSNPDDGLATSGIGNDNKLLDQSTQFQVNAIIRNAKV